MSKSASFDHAVDYYDETRGYPPEQQPIIAAAIAQVGGWGESTQLLEIGVGTGRVALPLAPHVKTLYGIDLSRKMMDKLIEKQAGERVILAQGDATRLSFPADTFDGAMVSHVFHLIPNWQQAAKELQRVMRPGTRMVYVHLRRRGSGLYGTWRELRKQIPGLKMEYPGEMNAQVVIEELKAMGWQLAEYAEHTYKTTTHIERFADRLNGRQHTWMWALDDETLAKADILLRKILKERYGSLDQSIETTRGYRLQSFTRPA